MLILLLLLLRLHVARIGGGSRKTGAVLDPNTAATAAVAISSARGTKRERVLVSTLRLLERKPDVIRDPR